MESLLPKIDDVLEVYSSFIEREDVDSANRFLASLCSTIAFAVASGKLDEEKARSYLEELREKVVEGPGMLNPYVFGLLGDLIEDPKDINRIKERLIQIWSMDELGLED
ncbi:hypothetical protein EYM_05620 [Ignicoccus islandicus DSM 13165]|uniref:Uncharacterized protein n=1 Tax=Ignicoccus islandicus DSM 13165 TaxID=940295 RepID=A0A0U3DYG9_9CREN|nr:hypothetical protein [Ignicoccus islandicus]ALU12602.1 hypothetical protein EYM_05620 [Ignicoccus islandicus DSM 13165]